MARSSHKPKELLELCDEWHEKVYGTLYHGDQAIQEWDSSDVAVDEKWMPLVIAAEDRDLDVGPLVEYEQGPGIDRDEAKAATSVVQRLQAKLLVEQEKLDQRVPPEKTAEQKKLDIEGIQSAWRTLARNFAQCQNLKSVTQAVFKKEVEELARRAGTTFHEFIFATGHADDLSFPWTCFLDWPTEPLLDRTCWPEYWLASLNYVHEATNKRVSLLVPWIRPRLNEKNAFEDDSGLFEEGSRVCNLMPEWRHACESLVTLLNICKMSEEVCRLLGEYGVELFAEGWGPPSNSSEKESKSATDAPVTPTSDGTEQADSTALKHHVFDKVEIAILVALSKQANVLIHQTELAQIVVCDRKTLSERLKVLVELGYVHLPRGPRKGYAITNDGIQAMASLEGGSQSRP